MASTQDLPGDDKDEGRQASKKSFSRWLSELSLYRLYRHTLRFVEAVVQNDYLPFALFLLALVIYVFSLSGYCDPPIIVRKAAIASCGRHPSDLLFQIGSGNASFIPIIDVCFDAKLKTTLYTKHTLKPSWAR